jgi:UDP-N-acetylmuramoyl-L-alanyl-D-glutamate--2,6-diaminopimelate ligase
MTMETESVTETTTIDELTRGVPGVRVVRGGDAIVRRVRVDSRQIEPGDLFVAIPGVKDDGLRYAANAIERGAAGVVSRSGWPVSSEGAWIVAESPRRAAALLAARAWGRPSTRIPVCGFTGTNGKTTSTFLLRAIAEERGMRAAVIGTLGAWLPSGHVPHPRTTPEAPDLQELLARAAAEGAELVAMEVSSHALDLSRVDGIAFAAAAFSNLSPEHLDWHKTMEAYGRSKMRLFTELLDEGPGPGGPRAILNARDPWAARIREEIAEATFFAVGSEEAEVAAHEVRFSPAGSEFRLRTPTGEGAVRLRLPGTHNVENALAAAGVAHSLGFDAATIARGLSRAEAPPGRFERVHAGSFDAFVDYAHTEDGLGRALEVARAIARGRVIVVLGCGGERDATKRPGMGRIASERADVAVFTTDNPRGEDPSRIVEQMLEGVADPSRALVVMDRAEALARACALAKPGDLVLACGKGAETYQEVAGVKHPFPEREILRDAAGAADAARGAAS